MEIYEREDGWYYCGEDMVEWGPFASFDDAEMMSQTPVETHFDSHTPRNSSTGNVKGSV